MNVKQKFIQIEQKIASLQYQSRKEEIANFLTHGTGACLSVVALVLLIVLGSLHGSVWHVVGFSIFGGALVFLYSSSMLFHAFSNPQIKNFFRLFDYSGIFLLIAGTYTPILLIYMRGGWGWSLFGVLWFLAGIGIILRIIFRSNIEIVLAVVYVLMGWIILVAAKPALEMIPNSVLMWLLIGGASYMIGLLFLSWKKLPYHHAVWHLFVLGGSASHFLGLWLGIGA